MILKTELATLQKEHAFRGNYHAETGAPFGENDDLNGLFPLHLVLKAAGVRIVNSRRVWAGGKFALSQPITIKQYGVTVIRTETGTQVEFPTGKTIEVDAEWQLIEDPTATIELPLPVPPESVPTPDTSIPPAPENPTTDQSIPVQTQRDPTTEVDITHIDFSPGDPDAPPRTFKIKVNRGE